MYAAEPDPYCFPGTKTLTNKLGLTEPDALSAFEIDAVTQRGDEPFPEGRIDAALFRAFHHHLFQDVYGWAGQFRTVRIHRERSTFCYPENIADQLDGLFDWLAGQDFLAGVDADSFAVLGAHFLSELNAIHAFREGNGRTQMAFFAMLAARAGHPLDLERLEPEHFLDAMIAAFDGAELALAEQLRSLI